MANYGPPGGPYPGPPPDPDRRADDEYGEPADPWGDHDLSGGQAGHPPTRYQEVGSAPAPHAGGPTPFAAPPAGWVPADPDPVWAPPHGEQPWPSMPDPAQRGGGGRVVAGVLVTLALLVLGGAALGVYLFGRGPSTPTVGPTSGPTGGPVDQASPSNQPAPAAPAPSPSTDVRFVKAGQCVTNEGTEADPVLTIAACASRNYEVLARYDGATTGDTDAKTKCAKVGNYTNYFFFNSELDELDFVLCLRKR